MNQCPVYSNTTWPDCSIKARHVDSRNIVTHFSVLTVLFKIDIDISGPDDKSPSGIHKVLFGQRLGGISQLQH